MNGMPSSSCTYCRPIRRQSRSQSPLLSWSLCCMHYYAARNYCMSRQLFGICFMWSTYNVILTVFVQNFLFEHSHLVLDWDVVLYQNSIWYPFEAFLPALLCLVCLHEPRHCFAIMLQLALHFQAGTKQQDLATRLAANTTSTLWLFEMILCKLHVLSEFKTIVSDFWSMISHVTHIWNNISSQLSDFMICTTVYKTICNIIPYCGITKVCDIPKYHSQHCPLWYHSFVI